MLVLSIYLKISYSLIIFPIEIIKKNHHQCPFSDLPVCYATPHIYMYMYGIYIYIYTIIHFSV